MPEGARDATGLYFMKPLDGCTDWK
uniref:Uncharacterized protein n=1 Tax=Anguilla anguilla TaxID=7936 RepID=A0A0E9U409_ANGAN